MLIQSTYAWATSLPLDSAIVATAKTIRESRLDSFELELSAVAYRPMHSSSDHSDRCRSDQRLGTAFDSRSMSLWDSQVGAMMILAYRIYQFPLRAPDNKRLALIILSKLEWPEFLDGCSGGCWFLQSGRMADSVRRSLQ
jgi:hypothetical protein